MIKYLYLLVLTIFYLCFANITYAITWPTSGDYPYEIESDYGPRKVGIKFHKGLDLLGEKIGVKPRM